jgi:ATP adenylyltransferase
MDVLWSTWRSKYIQSFKDEKSGNEEEKCFLCEAVNNPAMDKELLVVARRDKSFAMLNRYPYNGGHLLIVPYSHIGNLEDLPDDVICDMMKLVKESVRVIEQVSKPHGFNIGINMGRVSGAGLPGHIHIHVVPRWNGDTSFMSVLSDVKVVSQSLEESQELLQKAFANNSTKA